MHKILIANRGEIAVRIARAARDAGLASVAVYSDPDAHALHTTLADEAYRLPGDTSADTYLNVDALLDVAARAGADAVHPGYGFLSENADFARAVMAAGLTWIGPDPGTIETLGDKIAARTLAAEVGAPLAPGTADPLSDWTQARDFAREHGLPIAIKAAFGGGGRGLRVAHDEDAIAEAFAAATRESREAFGRTECFVEKFLERPRHVEAQVLADRHGTVVVVGLRDCSLQRRNQKLVEEAPAPFLSDAQTEAIISGAIAVCRAAGYVGAGTVEFLVADDGTVSFLEVNTRLQVEHPITEMTTGVDLVAEQFRIAAGEPLSFTSTPEQRGHAFEFRLNAENTAAGFVPSPGTVERFAAPTGPGIRMDSGVRSGSTVPPFYDSLMGKLVVHGATRAQALARARDALAELEITGIESTVPFHRTVVEHPDFTGSEDGFAVFTTWIDSVLTAETVGAESDWIPARFDTPAGRVEVHLDIDGVARTIGFDAEAVTALGTALGSIPTSTPGEGTAPAGTSAIGIPDGTPVLSPYPGRIITLPVASGAHVEAGETIAVVEAMKMESPVLAPCPGTVELRGVAVGDTLEADAVLAVIRAEP